MHMHSFRSMASGSIEGTPFIGKGGATAAKTIGEYQRVTVYVHGATGSFLGYQWFQASRVTLSEHPCSGYLRAVRVSALRRGKRTESIYVETIHSSTVIVEGWDHPELPSPYREDGEARYGAFEEGWDIEFAVWLATEVKTRGIKVLVDLRSHDPQRVVPSHRPVSAPPFVSPTPAPAVNRGLLPTSDNKATSPAFCEGATVEIIATRYERDPEARAACLKHYGPTCVVCGFDFERVYGEMGKGYIHVHHLEPLASDGEAHEVDPVADLRPVCPNCHAMLHRRTPPLLPDELKAVFRPQAGR